MDVWIKVIKPLRELYGAGTIVKEQLARVIDWENNGLVERIKDIKNIKEDIKPYKEVKSK